MATQVPGQRNAGMTVHWALRAVNTSHHNSHVNQHAEGVHVAWAAHSFKHVLSEAEYIVHLVVVSSEVKLDVPRLWRSAWTMTHTWSKLYLTSVSIHQFCWEGGCFLVTEIAYTVIEIHWFVGLLKKRGWSAWNTRRRSTAVRFLDIWLLFLSWNIWSSLMPNSTNQFILYSDDGRNGDKTCRY